MLLLSRKQEGCQVSEGTWENGTCYNHLLLSQRGEGLAALWACVVIQDFI